MPAADWGRGDQMSYKYVYVYGIEAGTVIFVRKIKGTTWELPGGRIEPGEVPEAAAKREFLEETGYDIHNLQPIETEESGKLAFIGKIGKKLRAYNELEIGEVKFFNCDQIPHEDILSFPHIDYMKVLSKISEYELEQN